MELTERRSSCHSAYLHAYKQYQYRLGTQVVYIIKYANTDREIERPSTKEKRPHFLLVWQSKASAVAIKLMLLYNTNARNLSQ